MIEIKPLTDEGALAAAKELIRAHIEAHAEAHHEIDTAALLAALPAPYVPPEGGLWLAWDGLNALGCVALQPLTQGTAEVKRMYVRPASRGRGIARALAQRVVVEARALGYERLRLGTLTTMHAAQKLYTSLGFRPIPPYRAVEFGDTLFYELEI
jgi:GNAT superfamily N-acetyltransferase